jgi:hypothetical protein
MPGKFIKKLSQKSVKQVEPAPEPEKDQLQDQHQHQHQEEDHEPRTELSALPQGVALRKPELAPLALNPKKKRGKLSRSNLKKKRENKHAVLIQSKWRGHCTRKTIAERKADKEREREREPLEDNAEEEQLEAFKRVPFAQLRRVQFCVDGAEGLPVSCTATRVSCRLLQQDRTPLTEAGESYSDPETPVSSPDYDLFLTWKGKSHSCPPLY